MEGDANAREYLSWSALNSAEVIRIADKQDKVKSSVAIK
jgi:hypothetical protein